MKSTKFIVAAAAFSGLLAGASSRASASVSPSSHQAQFSVGAGVKAVCLDDKDTGKHACKGQNSCKGQGGCKTGDNGCKAKNSCKGHGGCKTTSDNV